MSRPFRPLHVRFSEKVQWTPTCWLWTGYRNKLGYGDIAVGGHDGGAMGAHRASYMIHRGPIPEGLVLDHLCRNPSCVNPDHLEAVTQRENVRRGEGIFGVNARKTLCKRGHALTLLNALDPSGNRYCRPCAKVTHAAACRAYRRRKTAERMAA